MRLPSISTLKSYINECLFWNQHKNCYVGYLDFENEMQDYQAFAIQCQQEIESTSTENKSLFDEQKYGLATQVHQIVWHSVTYNFAFPISYYGINNITAHCLNTLIFSLAAKLKCYASKWSFGDLVEVNFNKDKRSFYAAKIIDNNFKRTKFTVCQLDCNDPNKKIEVKRNFIRPPMPLKLKWNVNERCEFKNSRDNQWYLGKITKFDPVESTLSVKIKNTKEGWKVFSYHIGKFLRPIYNSQELLVNHKTINPITGENWFFISDPTHVFKKLRNNLSKSHTGEKNAREIMFKKRKLVGNI
ncbi:uncharacterized protein OCT59_011488 [Rhizophagus irregularis]|uniref:uncharacterized protein n=1 Tax=Rhizophagus irregularis TaxID=588596 RepID=UPI00333066B4|nr:hypothetical protein OCT59_011488 [Rhizophagus irregularis]